MINISNQFPFSEISNNSKRKNGKMEKETKKWKKSVTKNYIFKNSIKLVTLLIKNHCM